MSGMPLTPIFPTSRTSVEFSCSHNSPIIQKDSYEQNHTDRNNVRPDPMSDLQYRYNCAGITYSRRPQVFDFLIRALLWALLICYKLISSTHYNVWWQMKLCRLVRQFPGDWHLYLTSTAGEDLLLGVQVMLFSLSLIDLVFCPERHKMPFCISRNGPATLSWLHCHSSPACQDNLILIWTKI